MSRGKRPGSLEFFNEISFQCALHDVSDTLIAIATENGTRLDYF